MNIIYRKDIPYKPKAGMLFPHKCLLKEIQTYIREFDPFLIQVEYWVVNNGFYLFIYLDNGDRIDVSLD